MRFSICTCVASIVVLLSGSLPDSARSQSIFEGVDVGVPYFVNNYTPDEYSAHHQNWAVVEDDRGVMYVGNTHGILEYDGSSWRSISVDNNAVVRSLDVDDRGRVYVGAAGEFGYLTADSTGAMEYRSLVEHVPSEYSSFDDVWGTHVTDDGVYFQTWFHLFRWSEGEIHAWQMPTRVSTSFTVRGELYLWQHKRGIMRASRDSLIRVEGTDMFSDRPVYAMLPYGEDAMIVGTYTNGLFLYEDGHVERFSSPLNDFLEENKLSLGSRISDGLYGFATLEAGVGVIDSEGRVRYLLDEDSGLQYDRVYDLYPDTQGGLWIALYSGISRIVVPSPVQVFDQRRGVEGAVQDIAEHDNALYVATTRGLFRQTTDDTNDNGRDYRIVPETPQDGHWSLVSANDDLLASANDGIYQISSDDVQKVYHRRAFRLYQSSQDPRRVFAGLKDGVVSLYRTATGWTAETRIEGITDEVRSIMEDEEGNLWLGTRYEGVLQVEFGEEFSSTPSVQKYGANVGLPNGAVLVSELFNDKLFVSPNGVFRTQKTSNGDIRFSPDTLSTRRIGDKQRQLLLVHGDENRRVWFVYNESVEMYEAEDNGGNYPVEPAIHFQLPNTKILDIYSDGDTVWFATKDGLLRYDHTLRTQITSPPSALIREVRVGDDSLLFAGTFLDSDGYATTHQPHHRRTLVSYHENDLQFTYAAPSHNKPAATQYQFMLEGFDDGWSEWTKETRKEYANLSEGKYRFRVRARTVNGHITDEGAFSFQILPPWYRTWWAYGLYGTFLIGALLGYGRYRASVSARKLEQERRVNERLKEANAELRQANRLKDEFLANMSHELRTPLAAILGFADVLDEELEHPQREFVQLIKESGDRLYNTLDALLDLAKFRAGMVEVDYSEIDLVQEIDAVLQLFEPKAREKGLELTLAPEESTIAAELDTFCLERILTNIVGNAIKFTEEGEVRVHAAAERDRIEIGVTDTGIGIEESFLPNIFEAFRQESSGLARSHQGVGLGLAITKRMVDLMDGRIHVDSQKGEGTTFTITFPRRKPDSRETEVEAPHEPVPSEA